MFYQKGVHMKFFLHCSNGNGFILCIKKKHTNKIDTVLRIPLNGCVFVYIQYYQLCHYLYKLTAPVKQKSALLGQLVLTLWHHQWSVSLFCGLAFALLVQTPEWHFQLWASAAINDMSNIQWRCHPLLLIGLKAPANWLQTLQSNSDFGSDLPSSSSVTESCTSSSV